MTRHEQQRLATLDRRIAHLEQIVADWRGPGGPHYTRRELAALRWARSIAGMYVGADEQATVTTTTEGRME